MLLTNLEKYVSEFNELLNEFGSDFTKLILTCQEKENKLEIKVEVEDVTFLYDYDFIYSSELERKRYEKRYAKLSLYKAVSTYLNVSLPWGALTGIRPSKLAYTEGEKWKDFFLKTMHVSSPKADVIEKILNAQKPYMVEAGSVYDLFVSIPFCPSRCAYCSFISCEIGKEKLINEYIDALVSEINHAKSLNKKFRSIYVGGGTPVSISNEHFERVLDAIGCSSVEYTIEAGRPDCITEDKLKIMKEHNVTRLCVNPQTFNDKTLELIGRKHTAKDILEKFELVKKYGFDINMDLIAGLYGETFEDFKYSLDKTISLDPENITVHTLSLKKGSKLKETTERLTTKDIEKMVDYSHNTLQTAGYNPYYLYRQKYMAGNLENTGYSKPNKECVYNIDIMEEIGQIVACGANAVSKVIFGNENRIERVGAPKDIASYLLKFNKIIEEKDKFFK